jgi:lipopolysaccharide assembly LptE-like protein
LRAQLLAMLALGWALAGCGYQFGASGTNLPPAAKTICVEPFSNQTRLTGINDQFMRYLKDEIASHKRLTLVDKPGDADLDLSGALIGSVNVPTSFNSVIEPTMYGQTLVVRAVLRDTHTNKVIWSTKGLTDTEHYPIVSQSVVSTTPTFLQQNLRANDIAKMTDIQVAQTQARTSRNQMMANLAKHMYDSMATGF